MYSTTATTVESTLYKREKQGTHYLYYNNGGRYMKTGVTVFCINDEEYVYRESGGNRVYTTINSNSGRGIESGLKKSKMKRTTR